MTRGKAKPLPREWEGFTLERRWQGGSERVLWSSKSCGHVGRRITAQCLFHHVLCRRDIDLHATCSWARNSRVQDTVGAKIPQWCKRHWASQSKSHRELLITNQQPWLRKSRAAGCCQGSVQGQLHDTLSLPCPEHWLLAAASDGTQGEMNIWAKLVQQ